jgi:hypothetical protein
VPKAPPNSNGINQYSMMKRLTPCLLGALLLTPAAAQNVFVGFSEPAYVVQLNTPTVFDLVITHDPGDAISDDLFSFGTILVPEAGTPVILQNIQAAAQLDFVLTDPPAYQDPMVFGIKGTIDVLAPAGPYTGEHLASYTLSFSSPDVFDIGVDFFNTLGPSEQIFVAGDGAVLDPYIHFVPSMFTVIPEPESIAGVVLVMLGGWRLLCRRQAPA